MYVTAQESRALSRLFGLLAEDIGEREVRERIGHHLLELLSAEIGESVTLEVAAEQQFLGRLIGAGIPAGEAELLITREWAIRAGENDYTTDSFQQITGRSPRPLAEFLHEHRAEFV